MFTSLYPDSHEVAYGRRTILTRDVPTLTNSLRQQGYRTALFSNFPLLAKRRSAIIRRGFKSAHLAWQDAWQLNQEIFEWLKRPRGHPFFLFIHYYDVHSDTGRLPYDAPEPFRSLYAPAEPYRFPDCGAEPCGSMWLSAHEENPLDPETLYHIQALYDGGIVYLDSEIGKLFEELEQQGLLEGSLIIITSDHGEEFQEHGQFLHNQFYEELLHVPLLIHLPNQKQKRTFQGLVGLVDVAPTILDLLSIPIPESWEGQSVVELILGQEGEETLFVGGSDWSYGIRQGDWKLLYDIETGKRELFNLGEDPEERRDLSKASSDRFQALWTLLKERMFLSKSPLVSAPRRPLSRELRALGYLH